MIYNLCGLSHSSHQIGCISSRTAWVSGVLGSRCIVAMATATLALGVLKTYLSPTLSKASLRSRGWTLMRRASWSASASICRRLNRSILRASRAVLSCSVSPTAGGSSLLTTWIRSPRLGGKDGNYGNPGTWSGISRSYSMSSSS